MTEGGARTQVVGRRWLVAALAGMCVGAGLQGLRHGGNELTSALFMGLLWPEATASTVVTIGSWGLLVAAALLATRWWRVPAGFVAAWMATLAVAGASQREIAPWGVLLEQAVRYLGPVVLLSWRPGKAADRIAVWGLIFAAAATFAGHGLECLRYHGVFLDYLMHCAAGVGVTLDEPAARTVLAAIGVADLAVALLIVATRSPWVAAWMAFWGLTTAAIRIAYGGWSNGPETLLRIPNGGVPLVLAVLWWGARRRAAPSGS